MSSRFAALRIRPAHRDYWRSEQRAEEWLLIEWPIGDSEPLKFVLSTAPSDATLEQLVFVTKMRWRIERDYQKLKQEFGLAHDEGRGFHHHATLCIAAYAFLVGERLRQDSSEKKRGRLPDAGDNFFHRCACIARKPGSCADLFDRVTDKDLDFLGSASGTLGQLPHFRRDYGKAFALEVLRADLGQRRRAPILILH